MHMLLGTATKFLGLTEGTGSARPPEFEVQAFRM